MSALYPVVGDNDHTLLFKIANNFYEIATNSGVGGLTPPNIQDKSFSLRKKIAYITAALDGVPI